MRGDLGYRANNQFVRGAQNAHYLRHLRQTIGGQFVSALRALGVHAYVDKNHLSIHLRIEGIGTYRVKDKVRTQRPGLGDRVLVKR